jgi:hypothetical protein
VVGVGRSAKNSYGKATTVKNSSQIQSVGASASAVPERVRCGDGRDRREYARGPARDAHRTARLDVSPTLARTLRSTNAIESMISVYRAHAGRQCQTLARRQMALR